MYSSLSKSAYLVETNKTLSQAFTTVGVMLGITSIVSALSLNLVLGLVPSLALLVLSFVLIYFIGSTRNSAKGLVGLGIFSAVQGVTLGPLINHYLNMANGAYIVSSTTLLTAAATIACAMYAKNTSKDFSKMGSILLIATIVFIVAGLLNLFFKASLVQLALSGIGALLFSAWIVYDVNQVVKGHNANYIMAALSVYLDIINLFVNILQIVASLTGSSDD